MDNPFDILQNEVSDIRALLIELNKSVSKIISDSEKKEVLLSPEEARKLFNPAISKSTLNRWRKAGVVTRHIKGGRVFYKQSEILETAKTKKLYKANCPVNTEQQSLQ
jgi:hypothetical protein